MFSRAENKRAFEIIRGKGKEGSRGRKQTMRTIPTGATGGYKIKSSACRVSRKLAANTKIALFLQTGQLWKGRDDGHRLAARRGVGRGWEKRSVRGCAITRVGNKSYLYFDAWRVVLRFMQILEIRPAYAYEMRPLLRVDSDSFSFFLLTLRLPGFRNFLTKIDEAISRAFQFRQDDYRLRRKKSFEIFIVIILFLK